MQEFVSINNYIDLALGRALVSQVPEGYVAEVTELEGVLALGTSVDECLTELKSVIEEWVKLRKAQNMPIPSLPVQNLVVGLA